MEIDLLKVYFHSKHYTMVSVQGWAQPKTEFGQLWGVFSCHGDGGCTTCNTEDSLTPISLQPSR